MDDLYSQCLTYCPNYWQCMTDLPEYNQCGGILFIFVKFLLFNKFKFSKAKIGMVPQIVVQEQNAMFRMSGIHNA